MDKLLIYLGESIVVLGIFYSAYWLALRKGMHHRLSRFYLLTAIILALLLPSNFFNIRLNEKTQSTEKTINAVASAKQNYKTIVTSLVHEQANFGKNQPLKTNNITNKKTTASERNISFKPLISVLYKVLLWIYFIGAFLFLFRFVWQIIAIRRQIVSHQTEKENDITFVYIEQKDSPYSFGRYLFIPQSIKESPEYYSMLEHEKAHIHQKHTYDLLFLELIATLFWINPFIWLLRNSLRKVHEYLADEQVIKNGYDSIDYQALLLEKVISTKTIGLTSAFHFKSLNQRLAMIKNLSKTISAKIRILKGIPATLAIALSLLIGVIISCEDKNEQAFDLIKIQGEGQFYNFSTSSFGYVLKANDLTPTTMLALPGDLIAADDDFFPYKSGESYHFSSPVEGVVLNNGKVFVIKISDNPKTVEWLQQLSTVDFSSLDHIEIGEKLPTEYFGYIKLISDKCQNIGLNIDKWNEEMPAIIKLFKPTWMAISEINVSEFEQLMPQPELDLLMLSPKDGQLNEPLPHLPKLKHLLLSDIKSENSVTPDFLINNPQIETVECGESEITDFRFLNTLDRLKSLMVLNTDLSIDLQFIDELKSLKRISLLINEGKHWDVLQNLKNLNWLVVCGDISQNQFNQTIKANTGLQAVEVVECDSVNNLTALSGLKQLKALTVTDTLRDAKTPLLLSNLSYLSLPSETLQDSIYMAKLKEAVPNGVIVPNDGFCMGSGWFILFIPALFAMAWMKRRLCSKPKIRAA